MKQKKNIQVMLSSLVFVVVYGIIVYFVFVWLAKYSMLYAYFGNLVLILLLLAIDEYMLKLLQSKDYFERLLKEKKWEEIYGYIQKSISFKTELYFFYVLILIFSQILEFYPTLVGENLGSFILANNYSILLLVALDMLIQQYSKDRKRMKKITDKLKKSLTENQD